MPLPVDTLADYIGQALGRRLLGLGYPTRGRKPDSLLGQSLQSCKGCPIASLVLVLLCRCINGLEIVCIHTKVVNR